MELVMELVKVIELICLVIIAKSTLDAINILKK